ncbi:hypothetical protein [Halanaerobium hydrogeniformans]|uniref:Uncharacterized protein n=1 Tax=Halanaerobium hydrogeniformans TaxID=656519 RepID=E4RPB5_HALHG|nr:hypothetical protein [Halanaerobium hydrogeniformans]ADQ13800.1 hypothetical protein Halsa_0325 [Halanaerobium hydrogeniformans]
MKKMVLVMLIVLALIATSTSLIFAADQGRNMQQRMNIQTETAQYRENGEECTDEELQIREQRQETRMLKQEAGENGRFNQRGEQTNRQRFGK